MPKHAPPGPSKAKAPKKLFSLQPRANAGTGSGVFKKQAARKQKGLFEVARATHQTGPLAGTATNHVVAFVRPPNGDNAKLREVVDGLALGERMRWNKDKLAFTLRVYTKGQTAKILAALRTAFGPDAADFPEAVADEPWTDETNAAVAIVPCNRVLEVAEPVGVQFADAVASLAGSTTLEAVVLLDGVTYPLKEQLKELGFKWNVDFNNIEGANHWVRPAFGFNIQQVIDLFDSWGWVVNVFDGLEEDDK